VAYFHESEMMMTTTMTMTTTERNVAFLTAMKTWSVKETFTFKNERTC
jgi:hypothetical protein